MKNQILKIMFALMLTFTTFSCSDDDKVEIAKLPTILEIAKADSNYTLFVKALQKTGLDTPSSSPFNSPGSYTVFIPTDAAFSLTPYSSAAAIDALTVTQVADLKLILQNHSISLGTRADDLLTAAYSKTFAYYKATATATSGANLSMYVNKVGADVFINGNAKVIKADVEASNGIVHVVDKVILLPSILNLTVANPNFSTLVSVVTSTSGTYGDQTAVKNALDGATNLTPLTIFAPTNLAFTNALNPTTGFIPATPTASQVSTLLYYHVVAGNKTRSTLTEGSIQTTKTTPAQTFKILIAGVGGLRIEDKGTAPNNIGKISLTDIQATNGSIHVVEKVLQPVL